MSFMKDFSGFVNKEAPTIMSLLALGGVALTAVFAFRARPRAEEVNEEAKKVKEELKAEKEKAESEEEIKDVKAKERMAKLKHIAKVARVFAPVIITAALTAVCIVGANRIAIRRLAAAGVAYEAVSGDLKKYKEKLKEVVGEKKAEEVHQAVSQEKMNENYEKQALRYGLDEEIINTGNGDTLYYDEWSGRLFRSSDAAIERGCSRFSKDVMLSQWESFNTLYAELGLDSVKFGDILGFNDYVEPETRDTFVTTPSGKKAIALYFAAPVVPRPKYGDM